MKDKANPYPWTLIDSILLINERQSQPIPVDTDWFYFLLISERQSQPIPVDTDCFYFVDQWKTKPTHSRGHWLILLCWSVKDKANPYPWTLIDSILLISERQSQPIPVDTDWFYFFFISERQSQPIPVDTDCFYFVDQWKTKPTHTRGHWLILFCWSVKDKANPYPWTGCFYFVDQWKTKPTHSRGHWLILLCWSVKDKANPYPWTLIDSILLISERQSQPIPVDTDWFYCVDQWKTKPTHTCGRHERVVRISRRAGEDLFENDPQGVDVCFLEVCPSLSSQQLWRSPQLLWKLKGRCRSNLLCDGMYEIRNKKDKFRPW